MQIPGLAFVANRDYFAPAPEMFELFHAAV